MLFFWYVHEMGRNRADSPTPLFNSSTDRRIFMRFCINVMPLEGTQISTFKFKQLVKITRQPRELVKCETLVAIIKDHKIM